MPSTFAAPGRKVPRPVPRSAERFVWDNGGYTVTTITKAHYRGVRENCPSSTGTRQTSSSSTCGLGTGKFATIDYSDETAALYLGELVEFDDLKLKNLRTFRGVVMSADGPTPPGTPQVSALNCPGCGAALDDAVLQQAVTIVCDNCHSILDAQDPNLTDPAAIQEGRRTRIRR